MHVTAVVPSAITSLRVAAIPFVLILLNNGNSVFFLGLFLFSVFTDILDGYTARELNTTSRIGAYYDTIADFGLVAGVFSIFTMQGVYPWWILATIAISFALFIITSLPKIHIYDPIGKYWGGLLYVIIPVTAVFQAEPFTMMAQLVILGFFAVSLISRISWYVKRHERAAD